MLSPGVTPSPRARRRRLRLGDAPSAVVSSAVFFESSLESSESTLLSLSSAESFPPRRRPRPPRRRRRFASSLSSPDFSAAISVATLAGFSTFFLAASGAA